MQQAPKKKANYSSAPMTHYQNIAMAIAGNQNDSNFWQLLQSQGLGAKYFQNHIVDKTGFRSIANCPNYLILSAAERLKVLHEGKYCSKCLKPREASHQCNTSEHVKCKLCTMRVENCLPHMENNKDKLLRKQYFCNKNKYKFAMGPDDNVFFAQPQPDSQSNWLASAALHQSLTSEKFKTDTEHIKQLNNNPSSMDRSKQINNKRPIISCSMFQPTPSELPPSNHDKSSSQIIDARFVEAIFLIGFLPGVTRENVCFYAMQTK